MQALYYTVVLGSGLSLCQVRSVQCKVCSGECRVWSAEFKVRSVEECKVWSVE